MNVSSLVSNVSLAPPTSLQGQASVLVLKKAMQIQEASALQLVQAVANPTPASPPDGPLGRNIDIFA